MSFISPGASAIMDRKPRKGSRMAAMKPRTGDGPMEAVKEGRLIIVRVPLEGGGRLVVSVNDAEARELYDVLGDVVNAAGGVCEGEKAGSEARPFSRSAVGPDQSPGTV